MFQEKADRHLLALILAALLVRLLLPAAAFVVRSAQQPHHSTQQIAAAAFGQGDTPEYIWGATSIVRDLRYYRLRDGQPEATGPELHRPPGYPLLLVPGLRSGHVYLVTIVLQALLGSLTVYVTYRTALLLFDSHVARGCAALAAFEPGLILWSSELIAETLLTTCVAIIAFALVAYSATQRRRWLAWAAIAAAAAAYVKPVAYLAPAWIGLSLLIPWTRRQQDNGTDGPPPWRRRMAHAIFFMVLAAALLAPWHVRNAVTAGYWGFSTQIDSKLAISSPAAVIAAQEGRGFSDVRARFDDYRASGPDMDGSYANARRRGLRTILSAPATYAWVHAKGMFRVLFHPGAIPYLELFGLDPDSGAVGAIIVNQGSVAALREIPRRYPLVFWSTISMSFILLPYLLLPALGLWRTRPSRTPAHLLLLSLALYFVVAGGGPWGMSRFRQPIMPLLCILAGYGFARRRSEIVLQPQPVIPDDCEDRPSQDS